jgi:hypothetical protein
MQAWCHISTRTVEILNRPIRSSSQFVGPALKFPTDSKTLSRVLTPFVQPQHPVIRTFFINGLERAFSEVPATSKAFHPEAARREL